MSRVLLVPDLPLEHWPSMDRYALRLSRNLCAVDPPDLDVVLAGPVGGLTDDATESRVSDVATAALAKPVSAGEFRRYLARYWSYPRRVRGQRADILHVLDHSYGHLLARRRAPGVVTVHDLLPLITLQRPVTQWRERVRNQLLQRVMLALRTADAWIVSTHWLRDELASWLGAGSGIHVIPYGVDDAFFHEAMPADRAQVRQAMGANDEAFVVLHVGSVTERKNIPGVLSAVAGLRGRNVPARLVQVGGSFTEAQQRQIQQLGLEQHVHQAPRATEVELRAAYRSADVLLFPSLYEGFGLPVLEAMASGLPAVVSSAPALVEVGGDAAIVVDSRDPEVFVSALERLAGEMRAFFEGP